jgi:long-subunit acyl-CoA synthetase (AMP-forming)
LIGPLVTGVADEAIIEQPSVRAAIDGHVAELNRTLAPEERVHRVVVLADHWTPGSAELTPTDKLRRANIAKRYAARIEQLYRSHR